MNACWSFAGEAAPRCRGHSPGSRAALAPWAPRRAGCDGGSDGEACGDLGEQGPGELCLLRNGFWGDRTITMEQRKVRQQLTGPVPIRLAARGLPSSQRNARTWGSRGPTINLCSVVAFLVHSWCRPCPVSDYTLAQALQGTNPVQMSPALLSPQHCLNLGCSSVHHHFRFAIPHLYYLTRRRCW